MNPCRRSAAALVAILLLGGIAAGADPAVAAYQKGLSSFDKRDYDAAIAAFTDAIRLSPKWAVAYCAGPWSA